MSEEIGWFARAGMLYEQAVFGGDTGALAIAERELDRVEADLALARGRVLHAQFLQDRKADPREFACFARAAELYQQFGDVRGEAEALFWVGVFYQVVAGEADNARPALERSYALATQAGDKLTLSYAARHLGFAAGEAGEMELARERLEESVRLRREIGFMPGVAAGLLTLAELSAMEGRLDDARHFLSEGEQVAQECQAHGVLRWFEKARADLDHSP